MHATPPFSQTTTTGTHHDKFVATARQGLTHDEAVTSTQRLAQHFFVHARVLDTGAFSGTCWRCHINQDAQIEHTSKSVPVMTK
jgi:hypothetical protein